MFKHLEHNDFIRRCTDPDIEDGDLTPPMVDFDECACCGELFEETGGERIMVRYESWTPKAVDDIDAPMNVSYFYFAHKHCQEREDYEFEQGFEQAKAMARGEI